MEQITGLGFKTSYDLRKYFQIKNMSTLDTILKRDPLAFTNVRHPFERLVSGYLMFQHVKAKKCGKMDCPLVAGRTFGQFVTEYLLPAARNSTNKQTYERMNAHFKPTNAFCAFCNINYTHILKGETFSEDKSRILEIVGLEDKEVRLNVKGGNGIQNLTKTYFKNLTKNRRKSVEDLYKYDLAMFEYDPNLY